MQWEQTGENTAWQGNLRRVRVEGKGRRQPLRSSGSSGNRVPGLQGKESEAGWRSGRENVKIGVGARQLAVFMLGSMQR